MNKKFVSPILMWFIILGGIITFYYLAGDATVFSKNMFTSLMVVPAFIYWIYFFTAAIRQNKRAALSADKAKRIVTSGVYGIVRHPIYSADILLGWSLFLLFPRWWVLIGIVWLSVIMLIWMRLEEKALTEKFGNDYLEYKHKVPMIIPCSILKILK